MPKTTFISQNRRNPRYVGATVILAVVAIGIAIVVRSHAATLTSAPAQPADAFVDSIGVNTHTFYTDTNYGNYPAWRDLLKASGIRHIRDGIGFNMQYVVDHYTELAASGIRVNLIMGRPWNGIFDSSKYVGDPNAGPAGSIDQLFSIVKNQLGGIVDSVEGPNEVDIQGYPDWVTVTRNYQTALFQKIKADAATANLPVVGPSLVNGDSAAKLGAVPCDLINLHNYTGGGMETSSHIDGEISIRQPVCPGKPAYSTESNSNTGTEAGNQPGISERAQGIYTLRQYLEDWRKGIKRTFIYELLDERVQPGNNESTWGIVRSDFSPKPAYTALKNMITLLSDKGPAFATQPLSYDLTGTNADTRRVLLQKRDGSYWLAVWQETSVYQGRLGNGGSDLDPPDVPLSLSLGTAREITRYLPNGGTSPVASAGTTNTFNFSSSEAVTLVRLGPTGVVAPTAAPATPTSAPVLTKLGDLNADTHVNVLDLSLLLGKWGTATASVDLNNDGTVNILDLSILLAHWTG